VQLPFSRLEDFLVHPDQIIFLNDSSLKRWRRHLKDDVDSHGEISSRTISAILPDEKTKSPYFFQHPCVGNKICILQNVFDSSFERSVQVSKKWIRKKYNSGYFSRKATDVSDVVIFRYGNIPAPDSVDTNTISVMEHSAKYMAVLFMD
jgi:hypothetical protein